MNLSILIEESSRDRSIKLSLGEARALYLELGTLLMDAVDKHTSFNPGLLTPLGGNGYEAPTVIENPVMNPGDWVLTTDPIRTKYGDVPAFNAEEAKAAEESPETLRETDCWKDVEGCRCKAPSQEKQS